MSNAIFTNAKLNEVFFKYGVWGNIRRNHKFLHAPFDRVEIGGATYLTTRCMKAANGNAEVVPFISTVDDADSEDAISSRDTFFTELNPITMEQNEMGDWVGHPDDWRGMHQIGFI